MKDAPFFEFQAITKSFPGVRALNDVSLAFEAGEVHALVGENGAGKSTMMKLLSGVYHPTSGRMMLEGQEFTPKSPYEAQQSGVSIIFQEFSLISVYSVWENVFINREPKTRFGFIDAAEARRRTQELLDGLDVDIDIDAQVGDLSVVQQQMVEIAKALSVDARLLIMDEPTATLTDHEVVKLFEVVRNLKARGVTVIYISHLLEEVFAIADRVTVMKDGAVVETAPIAEMDKDRLVRSMVGREITDYFPEREYGDESQEELLSLKEIVLREGKDAFDLNVKSGEIVGIFGLVGAGQYHLIHTMLGIRKPVSGTVSVGGEEQAISTPREAIHTGIGFVTEDRKRTGILSSLSVRANTVISDLEHHSVAGIVNTRRELGTTNSSIDTFNVRCSGPGQVIGTLSGGNQQKVLIARSLVRDPRVIVLMEPTRGIDVGAKAEIYRLVHSLAKEGRAVVIVSAELPEIIGLCDRVVVMRGGTIGGEIDQHDGRTTEEAVMALAVGHEYVVEGVELS